MSTKVSLFVRLFITFNVDFTLALVALSRVWQLNLRGLSAVVDMFNTPAKKCKNYQMFNIVTKLSGFSYKVLDYEKKKKIWCLEFCQDIWKDWDQHFNIKILHFSSAKHSISKILKWRRFFIFWSFVKFCHLGKFLKEVGSNILGQSAFEDDDDWHRNQCIRWWLAIIDHWLHWWKQHREIFFDKNDFENIFSSWKC